MIRVHHCRLKKRNTTGDKRGFQSDFETVLMLLMLDDRTDYKASEIAHLICSKQQDPGRYKALNKRIYQRGFRKGLTDHLDSETKHKVGKATWTGKQWKASLNDREWHLAVGFFDCLKQRIEQHEAIDNPAINFYFHGEHGLIESDIPHLAVIKTLIPQNSWPQQSFFHTWPICSIFRQDLSVEQAAKLAEYEQPAAIQTKPRQAKTPANPTAKTGERYRFPGLTRPPFRIWFPALLVNLALLAAFLTWFRQPTELDRFNQLKDMNGFPAIQGLETMLADPVSELDRAWVIAALAEKLKDQPSEAHIKRLRELYRSPHADRDRLTDIIARMQEQVRFEPIFLTDPKQPQMICAIDHNPMIVFEQGKLRPGDWLNIDDITGYIKEIHFDRMVIRMNGFDEDVLFEPPILFGKHISFGRTITIYPRPMNFADVIESICRVENIEFSGKNLDAAITGSYAVDSYKAFLTSISLRLQAEFDGLAFLAPPRQKPLLIIDAFNVDVSGLTLHQFFAELSSISGFAFEIPDSPASDYTYFISEFRWESLFESLGWTYTYDYKSKTVRAKERER